MSAKRINSSNDIWQRVRLDGAPLIVDQTAIFVWFGKQAPLLMGDFNDWERDEPVALNQIAPNIWTFEFEMLPAAYIEYSYVTQDGERLSDPFNPNTVPNGLGDTNNYFYMPDAGPTKLAQHTHGAPQGQISRHRIEPGHVIANSGRIIYLYQPPVPGPYPLLLVLDGNDYLRRARLNVIIDNLIQQERIPPLALAMVQNNSSARFLEYSCNDATLELLQYHVLPLAQKNLDLVDINTQPGAYGVMGASMGGLMALYTAIRLPEIFGAVISQSGAFRFNEAEPILIDLIKLSQPKPIKIWLDVGCYDIGRSAQASLDMFLLLQQRGYQVEYREYPGGHNYPAWRDDLWRGLEYLFREKR